MQNRFTKPAVVLLVALFSLAGCSSLLPGNNKQALVEASPAAVAANGGEQQARTVPMFARQIDVPAVKPVNQAKFERAVVLLQAEDWQVAESILLEVTADQPELAGPWVNLALSRLQLGAVDEAQEALQQALKVNPNNCDALNHAALLARKAGNFSVAESHYQTCIEANPSYLSARLNLGILYELYMGRYGEALALYHDYQLALAEPDPQVNGWLLDLERRVAALAQR